MVIELMSFFKLYNKNTKFYFVSHFFFLIEIIDDCLRGIILIKTLSRQAGRDL
jgi:hypothetical protein